MSSNVPLSDALREEYEQLFAQMQIRPENLFEIDAAVNRIAKAESRLRYQAVEGKTGVPWFLVGIIHGLECSWRFDRHLHNGDPLTARTVRVPIGRPLTGEPPFDWEVSAADALERLKTPQSSAWTIADIAYALEHYNGFGYRLYHPHVKSPYLWSFTTIYTTGKYVADGKWSGTAKSLQCGAMAVLKRMIERSIIDIPLPEMEVAKADEVPRDPLIANAFAVSAPLPAPVSYPGRVLRSGRSGEDVSLLQERLKQLGIAEDIQVDGDFGEKTESAVKLFQARFTDEAGDPLEVDGVVGPVTWQALFGAAPPDRAELTGAQGQAPLDELAKEVLEVASTQIGVRESPPGSNRGHEVDQYLESVSEGLLGSPWCVAFIYWCFKQAAHKLGRANPMVKTASVWTHWEKAGLIDGNIVIRPDEAQQDPSLLKPGMIFHIDTGGRKGHAGLIVNVVGDKIVTIEGNTNDNGSREGIGVFIRSTRKIRQINLGFIGYK